MIGMATKDTTKLIASTISPVPLTAGRTMLRGLGALLLEDDLDPQSASSHSQPEGIGDRPTISKEFVDRRSRSKGRCQARRARANEDGGKIKLFPSKPFEFEKMVEESNDVTLQCGLFALFGRLLSLSSDYFHGLIGKRLSEPGSNREAIDSKVNGF